MSMIFPLFAALIPEAIAAAAPAAGAAATGLAATAPAAAGMAAGAGAGAGALTAAELAAAAAPAAAGTAQAVAPAAATAAQAAQVAGAAAPAMTQAAGMGVGEALAGPAAAGAAKGAGDVGMSLAGALGSAASPTGIAPVMPPAAQAAQAAQAAAPVATQNIGTGINALGAAAPQKTAESALSGSITIPKTTPDIPGGIGVVEIPKTTPGVPPDAVNITGLPKPPPHPAPPPLQQVNAIGGQEAMKAGLAGRGTMTQGIVGMRGNIGTTIMPQAGRMPIGPVNNPLGQKVAGIAQQGAIGEPVAPPSGLRMMPPNTRPMISPERLIGMRGYAPQDVGSLSIAKTHPPAMMKDVSRIVGQGVPIRGVPGSSGSVSIPQTGGSVEIAKTTPAVPRYTPQDVGSVNIAKTSPGGAPYAPQDVGSISIAKTPSVQAQQPMMAGKPDIGSALAGRGTVVDSPKLAMAGNPRQPAPQPAFRGINQIQQPQVPAQTGAVGESSAVASAQPPATGGGPTNIVPKAAQLPDGTTVQPAGGPGIMDYVKNTGRILTGVQMMQGKQQQPRAGGAPPPRRPTPLPSRLAQYRQAMQQIGRVGRGVNVRKYL